MLFNSTSSSAVTLTQNNNKSLLRAFISNYTSEDFLTELITVCLYKSDLESTQSNNQNNISTYIKHFIIDLNKFTKKYNFPNHNQISKHTSLINSILSLRDTSPDIITYNTVDQYINISDLSTKKLLQSAKDNRLNNSEEFKEKLSKILQIIATYYELTSISNNLLLYDSLISTIENNTDNIFESIKQYRDLAINTYNDLSKLKSINKIGKQQDYYILKNKKSTYNLAKDLVKYIAERYSFLDTSYELFSKNISGFESSSVHIFSAPSNHGKSLMLINLLRDLIIQNQDSFNENDAMVFVTLEDNIQKLTRRLMAILGNFQPSAIKNLYMKSSRHITDLKRKGQNTSHIEEVTTQIFNDVINRTVLITTNGKVNIVIKHCMENTFSPGDLNSFVNYLKVTDNLHVRAIFFDYVDCAAPTISSSNYRSDNTYHNQGVITQELRAIAADLNIPFITATQNNKSSENVNNEMSNEQVGDSYNKVRFTDYLYMLRMCHNKTFLHEDVVKDVVGDQSRNPMTPQELHQYSQIKDNLVVMECKITKAKDGEKNKSKYMLFSKKNLRIYDNIKDYINDENENNKQSNNLNNLIVQNFDLINLDGLDSLDIFPTQDFFPNP